MKRTIIFSAFMTMLLSAVYTSAQTPDLRLSFSNNVATNGIETGTIKYTGLEAPGVQVFEAVIPAATEAACFASRDFSMARPVGPDRASVVYNHATSSYELRWTQLRDPSDSCRVLLVGRSSGGTDLADWQANYGSGGRSESQDLYDDVRGDGSVRPVRHAISLHPAGSSSRLSVRHPAQEGEVVEVIFPDAANSNFRLLETSFRARSDAECVANGDFSAAVPVGRDGATIGYYPSSSAWFLRNSNTPAPPPCHALYVDGDNTVDARDYVLWRSRFGSSAVTEGDRFGTEQGRSNDEDEGRSGLAPGRTVTWTYKVTNTGAARVVR